MCVRWRNIVSSSFDVYNGVKQGGTLSPTLLYIYIYIYIYLNIYIWMDSLSTTLNCNQQECNAC